MLINKAYSHDRHMIHRTGLAIERHTLRREHEAFFVIKWVLALLIATVLMASCHEAFAEVYDSYEKHFKNFKRPSLQP